jgi:methylated-DNA-[protein]-cysteine S-methyltransferase
MSTTTFTSPLGPLTLAASATGLTRCTFRPARARAAEPGAAAELVPARQRGPAPRQGPATQRGPAPQQGPATQRGPAPQQGPAAWLDLARRELTAYFAGALREFTVPVDLSRVGQPHRRILDALSGVTHGHTTSYGALAAELGLVEDGPRTVGAAMARNPVLIIVPCHRVLGAGGTLTGYAGGLPAKRHLLELEARSVRPQLTLTW